MTTVSDRRSVDSVNSYIEVLFKYKYQILFIAMLTTAVAMISFMTNAPQYQSHTSLLIKQGREYLYIPEISDERAKAPTRLIELINAEMQILNSRDLKEDTIKKIGLDALYPDLEGVENAPSIAIDKFNRALTINVIPDAHVVSVFFRHEDPTLAAEVVNVLVDQFLGKRIEIYGKIESGFLQRQLDETMFKLANVREELENFKNTHDVYSMKDQLHLLLNEHQELTSALRTATNQVSGFENKLRILDEQLLETPESITVHSEYRRNKIVDEAKQTILGLQMKEQELLTKYREDSRTIESIRGEIAQVEAFLSGQAQDLKEAERTATNPLYERLESERLAALAELAYLRSEKKNLTVQVDQTKEKLATLSNSEVRFQELEESVQRHEAEYLTYTNKLSDAVLAEALDREKNTNVSVIEAGRVPLSPIGIPLKTRLLLAAFIGVCLGIGYAFLRYYFSGTYLNAESVEQDLGIPVVASFDRRKRGELEPNAI